MKEYERAYQLCKFDIYTNPDIIIYHCYAAACVSFDLTQRMADFVLFSLSVSTPGGVSTTALERLSYGLRLYRLVCVDVLAHNKKKLFTFTQLHMEEGETAQ